MDSVEQVFAEYQIDPDLAHRRDVLFAPEEFTLPVDIVVLMDTHGTLDADHYQEARERLCSYNMVLTSIAKWRHNPDTWIQGSEWQAAKALVRREIAVYRPRVFVMCGSRGYDLLDLSDNSWSHTWGGWLTRTGKLVLDGMGDAGWIAYASRFLKAAEEFTHRA